MQRTVLLLLLFIQFSAQAQTLSFYDQETKEPINGLVLQVKNLATDRPDAFLTDTSGKVLINLAFPLIVSTSHLGYVSLTDTLYSAKDYDFFLAPAFYELDEVVVTGQFSPQSAERSVFRVQKIDRQEIEKRAALTLEEVLNNQLNIRVNQDLAIGSSTISLQGVSSQNVKILVDGIPLVSRVGNGNGADLSQINLQHIERIEIVEGPMAVNFGANALAGVINLITKKEFDHDTEVRAFVQTESAGPEYGLDAGRHIQSLNINHQLGENWSVLIGGQHNDFLGFQGNAGPRQHEWNPKKQWTGNGLLKFNGENHSVHYRIDLLDELIRDFGSVQNNFLSSGENQPFAIDETYDSKRHSHQLQAEGRLPFLNRYTAFASYSSFERQKRRFSRNIVTEEERLTTGEGDQDLSTYRVWEFGGTGFLSPLNRLDLQVGYQVSLEEVGGGRILEGQQGIEDYGVYASMEWRPLTATTIRPGFRYAYNSAFGDQLIPSVQLRHDLSEQTQLRLSYGRGFRSPSVRELYFEFVDSNHRIFGNPDLQPERSNHISINAASTYKLASKDVKADLNFFFNDIYDQISIGQNINDLTSTTYLNVDRFKTLGVTFNQEATLGNLSARLGFSYIGRFNQISEEETSLSEFFYSPEVNANLFYTLRGTSVTINLFYKYTGRLQSYFTDTNTQGEQVVSIGEISDYHWLDATVNHPIGEALNLTLGARNLFNVTQINNSGLSGGAHSGGPSVPVSYGMSYFLKISYNLNLK